MTISHLLAEFAPERSAKEPILRMTEVEIEEERLTAFQNGYNAGWEDAVKAQGEARVQAIARFRQSLEDYAFTYHEARVQMLAQLHSLFRVLTESVLPGIAQDTLGASIAAELSALAEGEADFPVEIHVAPGFEDELHSAVAEVEILSFVLIADPGLEPGQIRICVGAQEREIDIDRHLERIRAATTAFFHHNQQERTHE